MKELIERLERATGPSRELDAHIELSRRKFLFGAAAVAGAAIGGAVPEGWIGGIGDQPIKAPAYTASLDAALTLVPEGWLWTVATWCLETSFGYYSDCAENLDENGMVFEAKAAATPSIALCIAALRAREQVK